MQSATAIFAKGLVANADLCCLLACPLFLFSAPCAADFAPVWGPQDVVLHGMLREWASNTWFAIPREYSKRKCLPVVRNKTSQSWVCTCTRSEGVRSMRLRRALGLQAPSLIRKCFLGMDVVVHSSPSGSPSAPPPPPRGGGMQACVDAGELAVTISTKGPLSVAPPPPRPPEIPAPLM